MMSMGHQKEIELVAQRIDFLETLAGQCLEKRDIVDELDHSRSTVDRAIRDLEAVDLVERSDGGYVTTIAGRLAAQQYRAFRREQRDILDAREALDPLPSDCTLPREVVVDSSITTEEGPFWLFEHVAQLLRSADRYRAVLPRLGDARHLRLCQTLAGRGDLDATVVSAPSVHQRTREEFPRLVVGLVETDGVVVESAETPPYGLLLVEREDEPATVAVVTYDEAGAVGLLRNDSEAAITWANERIESVRERARDAAEVLGDIGDEVATVAESDRRLSATLRTEGFVRIDAAFLDSATRWRSVRDCSAGTEEYAVDRESLCGTLQARLRAGEDVVLVGPPGSGKSALCKRVAVRWYEADDGAVLYRESDGDRPFEAVGVLESVVESARGHTLIVVEDAVRKEANAIFDVMETFSGREDITFLLDAHEREWEDPEDLPVDARLAAFRQEAIETVTMPQVERRAAADPAR